MISKEKKTAIMQEYGRKEGDTGSPEVQIAVLTERSSPSTSRSTPRIIIRAAAFRRWSVSAEAFSITSRRTTSRSIVH